MKLKTVIVCFAMLSIFTVSCISDQKNTKDKGTVVNLNDESHESDDVLSDVEDDSLEIDESLDFSIDSVVSDDSIIYYDDAGPESKNE